MAGRALTPFVCPECRNGELVKLEIEEKRIHEAERLPALVTVSCSNNHVLVLFVDGNFTIRDIEVASSADAAEKGAIEKTADWFESL
ncbi:MAG: hypothetical protein ACFFF4_11865 [Candidatus Thorarchaeota archaeon]